ncbi:helicase HerA domain-containing protein [Ruminococcus flavefaciens]|uniref:helicase HerA domain-containing protein n=1 Tax=Ruminococcus flavefaciens TaxID=1265 RepID=UPI00048F93C0|nr:DUF87 domain-containing protein [Ruminococcus flavefaciens]
MGLMKIISGATSKVNDKISKAAALSPKQLSDIADKRENYLLEMPKPNDVIAQATTEKLIAANSIEVFNAYLPQISKIYSPIEKDFFDSEYNIRYFNITKWVTDKKENSLEKLVNVYAVLSDETCNIALVFHRKCQETQVYLAVTNTKNANNNNDADTYKKRLQEAIKGNFPGTEFGIDSGSGIPPFLNNDIPYSVASASNIPTEKSEKFISQTIEKLLDGIVPSKNKEEYTLILLASPINDVEDRKLRLAEIYTGLKPYESWQTNFTFTELHTEGSTATVGVNVGASAGIQNGQTSSATNSDAVANSESDTETDTTNDGTSDTNSEMNSDMTSDTDTTANSHTDNKSSSNTDTNTISNTDNTYEATSDNKNVNASLILVGGGSSWGTTSGSGKASTTAKGTAKTLMEGSADTVTNTAAKTVAKTLANTVSKTTSSQVGHAVAKTLGKTVTNTLSKTAGVFSSTSLGVNFGMNFARSSNVSASVGKNEGIVQSFENYNIKHALELLEDQMKRLEQSTALGMWDFAAYVLSEDRNVANNVAHTYLSLTQGESSYMSSSAVNLWRGDIESTDIYAKTICSYLRELRHPIFALNPDIVNSKEGKDFQVYPTVVTATTSLSGKELAYSLNFPQKSISGLPVIQCADFGRSVSSFEISPAEEEKYYLGNIFHMLHEEKLHVELSPNAMTSHTFITGSTGSGKSNTVYQLLSEAINDGKHFLVIEPAKGEYKNVFGNEENVSVFGTNPYLMPLLKINPFSFPKKIHILEHLDGLIEIFNVCWPMYAAMPAVLKNAIESAYEDCGWDLKTSKNAFSDDLYPNFDDVVRNIKKIIDSSEYDTENKGAYKGSLITRLKSLTNGINGMIFTNDEISSEALFENNVICDLSRVRSNETKSLIMGLLILKLQEYRLESSKMNADLQHITVIEEAHNLLKRTSTEQPVEGGNLLGKSVEMLSNSIAEMRTYGEGFIIVDQSPGLLDMSVIRNTNIKIIMRLPDENDRILVGKAANLNDDQIIEIARFPRGVAAVYQNEWVQPVLCKVKHVEYEETPYNYTPCKSEITELNFNDKIQIAKLLCNGIRIDKEQFIREIKPKLTNANLSSYIQVLIQKTLNNPPNQANMEQIGEIVRSLFPDLYSETKKICSDTSDKKAWTNHIETLLLQKYNQDIDDITRRYIIHGLVLAYVYLHLNDVNTLKDWTEMGGLK